MFFRTHSPGGAPRFIASALLCTIAAVPAFAGQSVRLCASELRAMEAAGNAPARALAGAWEELFREGLASDGGKSLHEWALAGTAAASRRAVADWFAPPVGILPPPLEDGFRLLRDFLATVEASVVDRDAFFVQLEAPIAESVEAELDRLRAVADAGRRREGRALRLDGLQEFDLGRPGLLSGVTELTDGTIAATGYARHPLALFDRGGGGLRPVDASACLQGSEMGSEVSRLGNGGFVISSFQSRLGIHAPGGELLSSIAASDGASPANRTRPVEAVDGTIAYVAASRELVLVHPGQDWKVDRIPLDLSTVTWDPIALRDGTIGVAGERGFEIYDTSGFLRAGFHHGWLANPPIELRDGSIALTVSGGSLRILRAGGHDHSMNEEMRVEFDRRLETGTIVETSNGRVVVHCRSKGRNGLLFVNRATRSSTFVPMDLTMGGNPVALPDGGVAVVTRNELRVFDDEGECVNAEEVTLPGNEYFIDSPRVFRLSGSEPAKWGIAAMTQNAILATDSEGVLVLRHPFFAHNPTAMTSLIRLESLSDGGLLLMDTRGVGRIFKLTAVLDGK